MSEKPIRALLIEDDPGDARLIAEMLAQVRETPFDLAHADQLSAGLMHLTAAGPDVVLLDLSLPDSEGLDTFTQVRARAPHTPILVLTGLDDEALAVQAVREGAQDYLVKGQVDSHLLARAIRYAVERKRAEDTLARESRVNAAIAELSRTLIALSSLEHISYLVLEHAKSLTGSAFGYVGYIDPQTGALVSSTLTRDIWENCRVVEKDAVFQKFGGLWGWVLEQRQPLLTNDPAHDPRSTGVPPGHVPIQRFLAVPALLGEELVGQIALANPTRDYTERDLELVDRLALLYALAVQRQQAEAQLRRSEERYRMLFNSGHDAVFVHRLTEAGEPAALIEVNDVACRQLGYTREELLTLPPVAVIGWNHRGGSPPWDQLLAQEHTLFEASLVDRAGRRIPMEISAHRCELDGQPAVLSVARDITERKSVEVLQKTMKGAISAIARIVETRDPYTAGHQRRVAQLAEVIARELGLSEWQVEGIRVAGGLHDVGKVIVPAEILSRPGQLNEYEMSIIRIHPQTGYEILSGIEFPWPVAQIVRQHHEKLDGSGYPQGLTGESILLEARVLAVADVVEAMSSHRPYRPALGIEPALAEIERGKSSAYDPRVVEACVRVLEQGFAFESVPT